MPSHGPFSLLRRLRRHHHREPPSLERQAAHELMMARTMAISSFDPPSENYTTNDLSPVVPSHNHHLHYLPYASLDTHRGSGMWSFVAEC